MRHHAQLFLFFSFLFFSSLLFFSLLFFSLFLLFPFEAIVNGIGFWIYFSVDMWLINKSLKMLSGQA